MAIDTTKATAFMDAWDDMIASVEGNSQDAIEISQALRDIRAAANKQSWGVGAPDKSADTLTFIEDCSTSARGRLGV